MTDLYDDDHGGDTGGREEVLLRRLEEGSTAGMRDVVETLQPEQNAAMRHAAGTPVIIQGAAGSGKTTIGFHRLAWLTNTDRGVHQIRPEASMVAVPNSMAGKPRVVGFLVEKEVKFLSGAIGSPAKPFVVVLGGAKVSDKMPCIDNLLPKADHIIPGAQHIRQHRTQFLAQDGQ